MGLGTAYYGAIFSTSTIVIRKLDNTFGNIVRPYAIDDTDITLCSEAAKFIPDLTKLTVGEGLRIKITPTGFVPAKKCCTCKCGHKEC
jgi:hypothetical protein